MFDNTKRHHELTPYQRGRQDAYEQGLHEILARIDRLENIVILELIATLKTLKLEKEMKQSTQDLIDAFGVLSGKVGELEVLVDQAADTTDEAAKADLLAQIKAKTSEISGHLPTVADAGTAVAQAPEDTGATVSTS
jgi:hypothetical protein